MKHLVYLILLLLSFSSYGQNKRVCFSIDDLPVVNYGIADSNYHRDLMNKLILSLKTNDIPAIGFVNEKKLYDERGTIHFQVELLKNWVDHGLELGNHTYSHPDYNKVSSHEFAADILKGEKITKGLLSSKGQPIKYFRHPFLHMGDSKEKTDSLNTFLFEHGYKTAPVTIDNDDYLFAVAYHRANIRNDKSFMVKIGHDYVHYMEKKVKYYEVQSQKLFGRNINQILLIHASLLNSDYLDSLAIMFQNNGYEFISMEKALQDDVYKSEITIFSKWGLSWLDRWALSQGERKEFFNDDPLTPDYIKKMSE
jgi:peptidoglycan/xylan/chitin deacetylase (PgdA/CDA1 family)